MGTYVWEIRGDSCTEDNVTLVTLNMNACDREEFNCYNGECVGIEQRCDGRVDCDDKTGDNF